LQFPVSAFFRPVRLRRESADHPSETPHYFHQGLSTIRTRFLLFSLLAGNRGPGDGFGSDYLHHQPAGAKIQRFAAIVTAPETSGIAAPRLWFPDLDDGLVAVLSDITSTAHDRRRAMA